MSPQAKDISRKDVTILLQAWSAGDPSAPEKLAPLIYAELKRLARRSMRREHEQQTLETGALLNEAYLRLIDWKDVQWQNRAHFFGVAAQIMRRILVDYARARGAQKRGDGVVKVPLDEGLAWSSEKDADFVALDDALQRLTEIDARKARVVELRFLGGLTVEEAAEVLNVSPETVRRDLRLAKSWLLREMDKRHPKESK